LAKGNRRLNMFFVKFLKLRDLGVVHSIISFQIWSEGLRAPVKYAALVFYEEFNWASSGQRSEVRGQKSEDRKVRRLKEKGKEHRAPLKYAVDAVWNEV